MQKISAMFFNHLFRLHQNYFFVITALPLSMKNLNCKTVLKTYNPVFWFLDWIWKPFLFFLNLENNSDFRESWNQLYSIQKIKTTLAIDLLGQNMWKDFAEKIQSLSIKKNSFSANLKLKSPTEVMGKVWFIWCYNC